jgi:hypothetical protein
MDPEIKAYIDVWESRLGKMKIIDQQRAKILRLELERYILKQMRSNPTWAPPSEGLAALNRLKAKLDLVLADAVSRYKLESKALTTAQIKAISEMVTELLKTLRMFSH